MAKSFNTLKPSELSEFDVLSFGKMKGCRIHDLINEDYEYLIWLEKNTSIKYNRGLIEKIKAKCLQNDWERFVREEIRPWQNQYNFDTDFDDPNDDIPF